MKKIIVCLILALLMSFAQPGEIVRVLIEEQKKLIPIGLETQETAFSHELGIDAPSAKLDVTLYFRYGRTELLGAQCMRLDILRDETVARSIVDALLAGPNSAHGKLRGLFPQGTRALSVTGDETTTFVTLSQEFLGRPEGAPADWEDIPSWQEEAALRRLLAAQSLVLALTENAMCQRVQIYVADSDDDLPERIPLAYFDPDVSDASAVLTACGRDEGYLLTPERTLRLLLSGWQKRDWRAVYELLTSNGAKALPVEAAFEKQMEALGVALLSYDVTPGTVSLSGDRATLVMNAKIRSDEGGEATLERESVLLTRVEDNWTLTLDALEKLMIRD